jgi:hypothetical protein
VQKPKQGKRFLFVSLEFFRAAKKEKHRLSCKHWRARKLIGGFLVLPYTVN